MLALPASLQGCLEAIWLLGTAGVPQLCCGGHLAHATLPPLLPALPSHPTTPVLWPSGCGVRLSRPFPAHWFFPPHTCSGILPHPLQPPRVHPCSCFSAHTHRGPPGIPAHTRSLSQPCWCSCSLSSAPLISVRFPLDGTGWWDWAPSKWKTLGWGADRFHCTST